MMLASSEDGKPRRLNYYTVIGCEYWNGSASTNSLPADWKMEVIRLCSKQKTIHLHEAQRLAAKHRITAPDSGSEGQPNEGVKTTTTTPENAIANEVADTPADSPVRPESVSANEVEPRRPTKKQVYALTPAKSHRKRPRKRGKPRRTFHKKARRRGLSTLVSHRRETGIRGGHARPGRLGRDARPGHSEVELSATPENDAPVSVGYENKHCEREKLRG